MIKKVEANRRIKMDKKDDSNIIIKQILEVSLAVIIVFCGSVFSVKAGDIENKEVLNVAIENHYEEAIVENGEDDYIHYEQIKYLEKKEIANIETEKNIEVKNAEKKENIAKIEDIKVEENSEVVPTEYKEVIELKATAYCLCKKCCGKSESHPEYGVTASGLKIIPGTNMKVIAVDPTIIPLGTEVYVEGLNGAVDYGYAIAADTGSAIKNLKIDLYMDSHEKAYQWGIKNVKLYVIK